jgi:hypothetical protein
MTRPHVRSRRDSAGYDEDAVGPAPRARHRSIETRSSRTN